MPQNDDRRRKRARTNASRIADTSFRLATNPIVTRQVLPAASVALRRLPHLASAHAQQSPRRRGADAYARRGATSRSAATTAT